MVSLSFLFWFMVVFFGFIGAMRGWAKELLVTFSMILALAFNLLTQTYIPFLEVLTRATEKNDLLVLFWIRTIVIVVLVYFGYQTVNMPRFAPKAKREQLADSLLGFVLGAFNGYLIIGSVWSYMDMARYPFPLIIEPLAGYPGGQLALNLIAFMPPEFLGVPWIYFAVILAFIFVIIVFI